MRPWTSAELEALRILGPVLGGHGCARAFERSHSAIKHKAAELGVSLRRPRAPQADFRPLAGPTVLRRIRELTEAELCPACGARFIGVKRTGLCGRCHFQGLVTVHEEEITRLEGQRELWAARSKLRRRRRELGQADEVCGDVTTEADARRTGLAPSRTSSEHAGVPWRPS